MTRAPEQPPPDVSDDHDARGGGGLESPGLRSGPAPQRHDAAARGCSLRTRRSAAFTPPASRRTRDSTCRTCIRRPGEYGGAGRFAMDPRSHLTEESELVTAGQRPTAGGPVVLALGPGPTAAAGEVAAQPGPHPLPAGPLPGRQVRRGGPAPGRGRVLDPEVGGTPGRPGAAAGALDPGARDLPRRCRAPAQCARRQVRATGRRPCRHPGRRCRLPRPVADRSTPTRSTGTGATPTSAAGRRSPTPVRR